MKIYIVTCLGHPLHVASSVTLASRFQEAHQDLWGCEEQTYRILMRTLDDSEVYLGTERANTLAARVAN